MNKGYKQASDQSHIFTSFPDSHSDEELKENVSDLYLYCLLFFYNYIIFYCFFFKYICYIIETKL
jgi:hypothetical protein